MKKLAKIRVSVSFIKQGKRYVAYSHALDLSSCGKSIKEAKKRFEEAALLFLEELDKKGTIDDVLSELGWKKSTGNKLSPPMIIDHDSVNLNMPVGIM